MEYTAMRLSPLLILVSLGALAKQIPPEPLRLDTTRLVRIWDSGKHDSGAYNRERESGERMLMAALAARESSTATFAAAGFTLLTTPFEIAAAESASGEWSFSALEEEGRRLESDGFAHAVASTFAYPPAWFLDKTSLSRLQCLEHGQRLPAFSPWEPGLLKQARRAADGLARRFGKRTPAAVWIEGWDRGGRCGLFGRTSSAPRHEHPGWWCGDPAAREDFRESMIRKYRGLDGLNEAWRTQVRRKEEIEFPQNARAGRRFWLDFVHWYRGGVTGSTVRLARQLRDRARGWRPIVPFPSTLDPRTGIDVSELARSIADIGDASIEMSAPGSPASLAKTLAVSACRFNEAPFWADSDHSPDRLAGDLFSAASIGARGYFHRAPINAESVEALYKNSRHLRIGTPSINTALLYSTTSHLLYGGDTPRLLSQMSAELRDVLDHDVIDERMAADGALSHIRVLVLCEGTVYERTTLERIKDWVRDGGTLIAYDFGKIETVEGDRAWFNELFGYGAKLDPPRQQQIPARSTGERPEIRIDVAALRNKWTRRVGKGRTVYFPARKERLDAYYEVIRSVTAGTPEPDASRTRETRILDTWDGVFSSTNKEHVIFYNGGASIRDAELVPASFTGKAAVAIRTSLAPRQIASIPFGTPAVEMLLQSEKFTVLGTLIPQSGTSYSPGVGPTHVLIPAGGKASTRFQCDVKGRYRVFYRAVRRGARAGVEMEVEGKNLRGADAPQGPVMESSTLYAGEVDLDPGVRNLTVRPRKGEDVRIDYIVLTTDPTIAGYTFPLTRRSSAE